MSTQLELQLDRSWQRRRSNLVLVRAGDSSSHKDWTSDITNSDRNWDLAVSYFGAADQYPIHSEEIVSRDRGHKIPSLFRLFSNYPRLLSYKSIWITDDDIATSWSNINLMFNLFLELDLWLAQPALTPDSYWSHPLTVQQPEYACRFVSFIEFMAPIFRSDQILNCLSVGADAVTGWGVDMIWPNLLGHPLSKLAVLDATPVRHTRAVGSGEIYNGLEVPRQVELESRLRKYDAKDKRYLQYGGILQRPLDERSLWVNDP